jgi:hypothetical protein
MEKLWVYYYSILLILFTAGMGYYAITGVTNRIPPNEHPIGINLTKENNTCRITWLGGWDFDSFYTNVTVNGVNAGHPVPNTVIYNDTCQNVSVKMYDRSVHSDIELYRYKHIRGV